MHIDIDIPKDSNDLDEENGRVMGNEDDESWNELGLEEFSHTLSNVNIEEANISEAPIEADSSEIASGNDVPHDGGGGYPPA